MVSIVKQNKIKMMIMQFQIQQKRFQNTIVSSLNRSYSETTLVLKIDIYIMNFYKSFLLHQIIILAVAFL